MHRRNFVGVGHLEQTGYIPAGSAAERERMRVKITAAMVREYDDRGLTDAPFDRFTAPAEYELTQAEATAVRLDAEYQGDVNGCSGIDNPSSVKAMYRRLHAQLSA